VTGYRFVSDELRRGIDNGEFPVGSTVGTEKSLCERWNVSRSTVRRALRSLAHEGLLVSHQGLGWFVNERRLHQQLAELEPLNDVLSRFGEAKVEVTAFGLMKAPHNVAAALALKQAEPSMVLLERLHYFKSEPLAVVRIWLIDWIGSHLSLNEAKSGTIFPALPGRAGIGVYSSSQTIRAQAVDERDAGLMKLKQGEPVLRVDRVSYTKAEEAVAYTEILYRPDRFEFRMNLKWGGADAWQSFISPGVGLNNSSSESERIQ